MSSKWSATPCIFNWINYLQLWYPIQILFALPFLEFFNPGTEMFGQFTYISFTFQAIICAYLGDLHYTYSLSVAIIQWFLKCWNMDNFIYFLFDIWRFRLSQRPFYWIINLNTFLPCNISAIYDFFFRLVFFFLGTFLTFVKMLVLTKVKSNIINRPKFYFILNLNNSKYSNNYISADFI